MQKKIIALAITAALTVPALAFAEANVYGQFNLAIDMAKDGNASSTSANQMNSYGSRVGVKGKDSLDGGMSLDYQLEGGVPADSGGGFAFDRESNLGLTFGEMGTVRLGLQASPYKAVSRKLDVFGDTIADTRNTSIVGTDPAAGTNNGARTLGGGHDSSAPNAISYKSPSMGGFTVVVATMFGAETLPQPAAPNDKKGTAMGLAAMYDNSGIFAAVAIDNAKFGDAGTGALGGTVDNEDNALKLGGGFSMDAFTINAAVDTITQKTAAAPSSEAKNTNLYLGAKFNIGSSDAVKVAITKIGATKRTGGAVGFAGTAKDGATQIAAGYDHSMSKNTSVYALYTKVSQEDPAAPAAQNPDPSVISFGLKHAF